MTAERPEVEAAALPHEGVNAHSAHTIVIVGAGQAGGWAAQTLRDSEGQRWLRLDLAQLAQAERFLDAGFGAFPALHKDIC